MVICYNSNRKPVHVGTRDQTVNVAQSLSSVALTPVGERGKYRANFDNSGEHPDRTINPGICGA